MSLCSLFKRKICGLCFVTDMAVIYSVSCTLCNTFNLVVYNIYYLHNIRWQEKGSVLLPNKIRIRIFIQPIYFTQNKERQVYLIVNSKFVYLIYFYPVITRNVQVCIVYPSRLQNLFVCVSVFVLCVHRNPFKNRSRASGC